LQHDATCHLAVAVEFGNAAPLVGAQLNPRNVLDQHWRTALALEDDLFEIRYTLKDEAVRIREGRGDRGSISN
jgi:hypothetical protein